MTLLESLKKYTTVVADTGDIESIAKFKPQDTTTNPSLLFQAAQQPAYAHLVEQALQEASEQGGDKAAQTEEFMDGLFVSFGREILKIVPGRVSTEVDAGLSFDTEKTHRQGPQADRHVRGGGRRPQADPDQDRQHLGGDPRRRAARAAGDPLQPDAPVQLRPGGRLRRGQGDAHLPVRRPDLRLVQEGEGGRRHPARRGPGGRVGDADLRLLTRSSTTRPR